MQSQQGTLTARLWPYLGIVLVGLVVLLTACAGRNHRPAPAPSPGPAPPVSAEAPADQVFWYDLLNASNLPAAARSSNTVMLRERLNEYGQLLGSGFRQGIVGCYDRDGLPRAASIVTAAKAAGIAVKYLLFSDEPDLGSKTPAQVNALYDAYRAALDAAGHRDVLIAPTFSLYGQAGTAWQWETYFSQPIKADFICTDSWYTGAANQIHLVRDRFIRFAALFDRVNNSRLPLVHILKAYSRNTPGLDLEDISGEWIRRQLVATTGADLGPVVYEWRNPETGELAAVTLQPLPAELLARTKAVGLYKMDGRTDDADRYGANCKDCVDTVEGYARPRGLIKN